MLEVAFGRFVSSNPDILSETARFLTQGKHESRDTMAMVLQPLIDAVNGAIIEDGYEYLEQISKTLDELLAIKGAVSGKYVTNAQLKLTTPHIFCFLQSLYISSDLERPIIILVGAVPKAQGLLRIPLKLGWPLEQLELAYAATDPNPRIRTDDLGIRLPGRTERQLLPNWETIKSFEDKKVEINIYQKVIPGAILCGLIVVEHISLSYAMQDSNVYVQVETEISKGIRTIVARRPGVPLLIVDKFITN